MGKILVAGGAGYLGSHMLVELVKQGYDPLCIDTLYNSRVTVLDTVAHLCGKTIPFIHGDAGDKGLMDRVFTENQIDAVIHFAGHKAVGESVEKPLMYYRNNYDSALTVLEECIQHGSALIFSSSATVYGVPQYLPLTEDHPLSAVNPYGRTKLYIEETIRDVAKAHPDFNVSILRYFNPVGAHESGLIGENPNGIPNNLMPFVCQTAAGIRKELRVFGGDYDTIDGTGVRDFIHVTDLISGHIAALKKLETRPGCIIHNLGTGRGTSVLEMVQRFEAVNHVQVPYQIVARREGDVASCYADPSKAFKELGWKTEKTLDDMVRDSWIWQQKSMSMK